MHIDCVDCKVRQRNGRRHDPNGEQSSPLLDSVVKIVQLDRGSSKPVPCLRRASDVSTLDPNNEWRPTIPPGG